MANTHHPPASAAGSSPPSAETTSSGGRAGLTRLKDLATRAGRWLGLGEPTPQHSRAIEADRFDQMAWSQTLDEASALRELAAEVGEHHDYATDLLADVWTAAYKTSPRLREAAQMDPSRMVNHRVAHLLLQMPEFTDLRRHTAGDRYAAAMAVLAQRGHLTRLLQQAEAARDAAREAEQTRQASAEAAQRVHAAFQDAAGQADTDGAVPDRAARKVEEALTAADSAEKAATAAAGQVQAALVRATPGMRRTLRAAAARAAEQAQHEEEVMAAWGVGPGQLERMDFATRTALAQRLTGTRLRDFADLIGRFRAMAAGERARRVRRAPGETVGLVLGDDLGRLVGSELANLGVPALRAVFAARLADGRLLSYESRGVMRAGRGAIIACLDCSGSMRTEQAGGITGEAWAKACALALLDQARAARRDFVGILFASAHQIATYPFPARQDPAIGDVLDFAESFFNGGTDFAAPLDAAADVLETSHRTTGAQHGDIVFITDGHAEVTEDWHARWRERKTRLGHRVFGISVTAAPSPTLRELSDSVHTITDLTDPHTVREMFQLI